MKKKIAVLLRGQIRTWDQAKSSIFAALKPFEESHDVTYFFVTWDKSYAPFHKGTKNVAHLFEKVEDTGQIIDDFAGRNLAKLHVISYEDAKRLKIEDLSLNEEYEFISFIRYMANTLKQNYEIENGFDFDEVFELRPDVFLLPQCYDEMLNTALNYELVPFTLVLFGNLIISPANPTADDSMFLNDIVWISDSFTSDLVCSEFLFLKDSNKRYRDSTNPHGIAADYLLNCKIVVLNNAQSYFDNYAIIRQMEFLKHANIDFTNISKETITKIEMANKSFQTAKESYFKS